MKKKQLTPPSRRADSDAGRQDVDEPAISILDPNDYEERESVQSFRTTPETEIQRSTTSIPRLGSISLDHLELTLETYRLSNFNQIQNPHEKVHQPQKDQPPQTDIALQSRTQI